MLDEDKSQYSAIFDSSCIGWTNDRKINFIFLKYQEAYFNDILRKRKYLFLRDVYEGLGIPITKISCKTGWIYKENNKIGDNFVKFLYDEENESNSILIDFNVDGYIIDRI